MKRKYSLLLMSLFLFALLALFGCNQKTEHPNDDGKGGNTEEKVVIKFAEITEKGKAFDSAFEEAKDFDKKSSGPFSLQKDPSTAYVAIKIDIPKPNRGDFSITVSNENSYLPPIKLYRTKAGQTNENLFVTKKGKAVILAKGENIILIEIKSPEEDNTKESDTTKYRFKVNYSGGPGTDYKNKKGENALIPGIYCPTMRKLSEEETTQGKKEECLWLMSITGG